MVAGRVGRTAGFLELAENWAFMNRKLTCALNETVDGHEFQLTG